MRYALKNLNRAGCIILLLAVGTIAGCAVHKPFELFDDKTVIKNSTIAVISANTSDATRRLASELTRELRERSTLKVWTQAKIDLSLAKYPVNIHEGKPENPEKPVWFTKEEKTRVDAMQAKLKVRYLFLVWTGFSRTDKSSAYHVSMNGNLVEYPKGHVIGYSLLSGSSRSTKGNDVTRMLKDSAALMADRFIKTANAEKTGNGSRSRSSSELSSGSPWGAGPGSSAEEGF